MGGAGGESRIRTKEATLWQRRFWEHLIRDEQDFNRHFAYIHYNPVKHGLAAKAADWPWSTFHRYVREGIYDASWGQTGVEWMNSFNFGDE